MPSADPVLAAIENAGRVAVNLGDTVLAHRLRLLWKAHNRSPIGAVDVDRLVADRSGTWWNDTPIGQAIRHVHAAVAAAPTRAAVAETAASPTLAPEIAAMLAEMRLTDEQVAAVTLLAQGVGIIALQAGAGSGKTHTLLALARIAQALGKAGTYTAFGKAIVREARSKMPRNVTCSTAHSLAFRAVGKRYEHRLNGGKMRSREVAQRLGITRPFIARLPGGGVRVLQPSYQANLLLKAIKGFCQSADPVPGVQHFPVVDGLDLPDRAGRPTWVNNDALRASLRRHLATLWADLSRVDGVFPFEPSHYFKVWALTPDTESGPGPYIPGEFILVDEAQDLSPALMDVVLRNRGHAQLVFCGDSCQAIMGFTGAIDALAKIPADAESYLTRSFRFGPEVAEVANRVLAALDAKLRVTGGGQPGRVGPVERPDAVLCRTNATAVETVMAAQKEGRRPWLVGGGGEVVRFAEAAIALREAGWTWHPELAGFQNWQQVQDFVEHDEGGSDLKRLVRLVDDHGAEEILAALGGMSDTQPPGTDLVVSTAHKAKGLQWPKVRVMGDGWRKEDLDDLDEDDQMLLYVAVTRAELELDVTRVACLSGAASRRLQVVA